MKRITLAVALLLAPASGAGLAMVAGHGQPDQHQAAGKCGCRPIPGMNPFPKRSVPVAGNDGLVKDQEAAVKLTNPIPADEKSVAKGGQLFADLLCPLPRQSPVPATVWSAPS